MRWIIFQVHWLLGISAGLVLALMGVTGAMMGFENEIMAALSPDVMKVHASAGSERLSPDQLIAHAAAAQPGRKILSLTLRSDPIKAASVTFAPLPGHPGHGDALYIDPYRGNLLGTAHGQAFFATVRRLHRFLALPGDGDGVGRKITGVSALALVYFALSGLYLRWPRHALNWRSWLVLDLRRTGRNLYRGLHAVIGGWVLLFYLLSALTGLWWSYGWYRDGLGYALTGSAAATGNHASADPAPGKHGLHASSPRDEATARTSEAGHRRPVGREAAQAGAIVALAPAWAGFQRIAGDRYQEVTIMLSANGGPLRFRGLLNGARHDRMIDEVTVFADGRPGKIDRYADQPLGKTLVSSMLNLHRGNFFGLPGRIVMLLTSLSMPLFAITGWLLYLGRRRRKRALAGLQPVRETVSDEAWLIAYASQTGRAQQWARQTAIAFEAAGQPVRLRSLSALKAAELAATQRALFVVSTYGEGEPPDEARAFSRQTMAAPAALNSLQYAVLALGDHEYPDFCAFGRRLDAWLAASGAQPLDQRVDWDGDDIRGRQQWAHVIRRLGAGAVAADWLPEPYHACRLVERRWLNPGSPGAPVMHVVLVPIDGQPLPWQAGDIAEVLPCQPDSKIAPWLALAPTDQHETLRRRLATLELPAEAPATMAAIDDLPALRPREYSIASLALAGRIELLVRQTRRDDGELGLASGWLTATAAIGAEISLRIRPNPGFRAPPDTTPMILIGSGTGLAGLLAHLRQRVAAGAHANWLLFGERSAEHDQFHHEELHGYRSRDCLRMDAIFSRCEGGGYVQELLKRHAGELRAWVAEGAAIYICGSLHGMAPAVDQTLRQVLGDGLLESLRDSDRYRRDIY